MLKPTVTVVLEDETRSRPVAKGVSVGIREHDDHERASGAAAGAPFLLVSLLLVLLSGVPQLGISLMEIDFEGKTFRQLPVTRSLLIDKLLPVKSTLAPPKATESPALAVDRPAIGARAESSLAAVAVSPEPPSQWQLHLVSRLYRHNSSYI